MGEGREVMKLGRERGRVFRAWEGAKTAAESAAKSYPAPESSTWAIQICTSRPIETVGTVHRIRNQMFPYPKEPPSPHRIQQ